MQEQIIVAVSGEEAVLDRVQSTFEGEGYRVIPCRSSYEVIKLPRELTPALFLIEIRGNEPGSFSVVSTIRKDETRADVPAIFLIESYDAAFLDTAFEAGAADVIPSGFTPSLLKHRVDAQLTLRHLRRALSAADRKITRLETSCSQLERRIDEILNSDPVTGLFTRRSFADYIDSEHRRSQRRGVPYSVALAAIEGSAAFLEANGAARMDEVLRDVADIGTHALYTNDVMARLSSDRFAILLSETGRERATVPLERILRRLTGTPAFSGSSDGPPPLALRFVVTTIDPGATSEAEALLEYLTQAMVTRTKQGFGTIQVVRPPEAAAPPATTDTPDDA